MGTAVQPTKSLTNEGANTLAKRLETILPQTMTFDCLVGYFFLSGFHRIHKDLAPVERVRIPVGLKSVRRVTATGCGKCGTVA
jgi:hypothetical protein